MSLVNLTDVFSFAEKHSCAVLAFDTLDPYSAQAFIEAAQQKNCPAVMMVGESTIPLINKKALFPFLLSLADSATVPVALQLDHGKTLTCVIQCIQAGFTSIMFDGSSLPLKENISATRKIVEIAHAANVTVEGELGCVQGEEGNMSGSQADKESFTKPEEAHLFVQQTGVDALAVSFGTVHGVYKMTPSLDFERLKEIHSSVSVPLVMHGSSGLSVRDLRTAIESGIQKINLFTDISLAAGAEIFNHYQEQEGRLHFIELLLGSKAAMEQRFKELFNAMLPL